MSVPQLPFNFTAIRAEFGGIVSTPLSAYVRGGAFVPIQTLGNIPVAPPISMSAFAGAVFPAALSYASASFLISEGWVINTQVVAPDLSTATFVISRTHVTNAHPQFFDVNELDLLFNISGAANPSVIARVPATQPRDGAGYWKLWGTTDFKKVCSPAQLTPLEDVATFEHQWHANDPGGAYVGDLKFNTPILPGNAGTPPQANLPIVGGQARLGVTFTWQMDLGTQPPPGVAMVWNTRNVSNTFVEFPLVLDVYDGAILRASYPMLLHFEMNAQETFNFV